MRDVVGLLANWPQGQTAKRKKMNKHASNVQTMPRSPSLPASVATPIAGAGAGLLRGGYCRLRSAGQHRSDLLMVAHGNLLPRPFANLRTAFTAFWHDLTRDALRPYRPELHYMRGPGPAWRANND